MKPNSIARRSTAVAAGLMLLGGATVGCGGDSAELAEPTTSQHTSQITPTTPTSETTQSSLETSESSPTTPTSAPPDCSDAALHASGFQEDMVFGGRCKNGFGRPGVPNSDHLALVQWDGTKWEAIPPDGWQENSIGISACYALGKLEQMGVPEEFRRHEMVCGVDYSPQFGPITRVGLGEASEDASYPACDARAILILDSVVDRGDRAAAQGQIADWVMFTDPSGMDREFTVPGQCPSLRAQVDGNDVYPIYLDFGSDVAAMCEAKAQYGGNGRVLSNRAEYVDPC